MIRFSTPGKIHLLGEHTVVYGKPALLTTINLRVTVTISPSVTTKSDKHQNQYHKLKKIIESIVKKNLKIKIIPPYHLDVSSQFPIGAGLGSSAAISASYIAALLTFLKVKWDLNLINNLTYEAERVFHGNPSGGDNSTIVYGGLIWFRKETPDLKIIQSLPFTIPIKIAKNFVLINTGTPKQSTAQMVKIVSTKFKKQNLKCERLFDHQEQLVKNLVTVLKDGNKNELVKIIKTGEKNLESLGVVSSFVKTIIRKVEKTGGAAKICGGGATIGPTGVLLCYHPNPLILTEFANDLKLDYYKVNLGVEGLRKE